jgi:glucose/arabinose dehydrogenase
VHRLSSRTARAFVLVLASTLVALLAPRSSRAVTAPPGFVVENAFPGQTFPFALQIVFLPDGRKLVVGQGGTIWVMSPTGERHVFLDISPVTLGGSGRGLLGVAIDPDFAVNRWVYLAYTVDPDSNGNHDDDEAYSRIVRYQVSAGDPNTVDPSTRQVLIGDRWSTGIPSADTFHSIGALRFAPDKSLLLSSGDAAHFDLTDAGGRDSAQFLPGRTDPAQDLGSFRSQSLNNLCGKILRIDKETGQGLPSNPYWNGDPFAPRSRIWVYGLRNPYRFIIKPGTGSAAPDSGRPGTLYIGDTGWNDYESMHVCTTGGTNCGWPCIEGPAPMPRYVSLNSTAAGNTHVLCSAPRTSENPLPSSLPQVWWNHGDGSKSNPAGWTGHAMIGGTFQVGGNYPAPYAGAYYAVDYIDGWIRWIQFDASDQMTAHGNFLTDTDQPVDIGCDPASGDLYYVSQGSWEVRRIRYIENFSPSALSLRADSASGTGAYDTPGASSPWADVVGHHDATLANFAGTDSSGWQGNGGSNSPYRLEFDGVDDRVTVGAGSVPELQSSTAASAELWFETGSDVTAEQYLLEWLGQYNGTLPGMSIAIKNGQLRIRRNTWTDVGQVLPHIWYQVVVTKSASEVRVYTNGQLVFVGSQPNLGDQISEIVVGASTFRGAGQYGEFYSGSIAQVNAWPSAIDSAQVLAQYQSSLAAFQSTAARVASFRADSASGAAPYPTPGAGSPWKDLTATHDAQLVNFGGNPISGWLGGVPSDPARLRFDGVDDRVTIPAGSLPDLQTGNAATVGIWVRTGSDVTTTQYLLEWLGEFKSPFEGMSLAISGGQFRVLLDQWADVFPVDTSAWYYFTVAKQPGTVKIYVDGIKHFTGSTPNYGRQLSEIVVGASTYRGAGLYGEYFGGSVGEVYLWRRALIEPEIQEVFHQDSSLYFHNYVSSVPELREGLRVFAHPNPFQSSWTLEFSLPSACEVDLAIYGVDGRRVRVLTRGARAAGSQRFVWDGRDDARNEVHPGVYFARLTTPQGRHTCRLVRIR